MKINHSIVLRTIEKRFASIEQFVIYAPIAHSPILVSMVKGFRTSLDFFKKSPPDEEDIKHMQVSLEAISKEYHGNYASSEHAPFS